MKKTMKVLGILLCAVLLVVGSVAATLAYLTAKTERVVNTFTVGNVSIKLDEARINKDGVAVKENGEQASTLKEAERLSGVEDGESATNTYNFMPSNASYTKDPTVTVNGGSDDCYVRLVVKMEGIKWSEFVGSVDFNSDAWNLVNSDAAEAIDSGIYEFRYKGNSATNGVISASDNKQQLEALFTKINRDTLTHDYSKLSNLKQITIEAHAIQAGGLTEEQAWEAFEHEDMMEPTTANANA